MPLPPCYSRRIALIDLSRQKVVVRPTPPKLATTWLGGKGWGAYWLLNHTLSDPLDPKALCILATGPITGLPFPGAAKSGLFFRSPLTTFFGESYCGGYFGPLLKQSGFDALLITGRASHPVYILVEDQRVELCRAERLWGLTSWEAEAALHDEHGRRAAVAVIGPAGERLVRFACITHAYGRQFGRCGGGAVWGSKHLKAVVAAGGDFQPEPADPDAFNTLRQEVVEEATHVLRSLTTYGTPSIIRRTQAAGVLPTRYWTEGVFDGFNRIHPERLKQLYTQHRSCYACPVACGKVTAISNGPYRGTCVEGPEYETLFALGSLLSISDPAAIAYLNALCDQLGLDTISTGNVIGFLILCIQSGILDSDKLGFAPSFGDPDAAARLIRLIAYRKDFGTHAAEGVARLAARLGPDAQQLAIHVKGLEPPGYDPRGLKGVALAYAVACRGACHLRHVAYRPDLAGQHPFNPDQPIDRLDYASKPPLIVELEDFYATTDSLILCRFLTLPSIGPILWDRIHRLLTAITGWHIDLRRFGAQLNHAVRQLNTRYGLQPHHDTLPPRFFNEPLPSGPSKGEVVDPQQFQYMLHEYYRIRGLAASSS